MITEKLPKLAKLMTSWPKLEERISASLGKIQVMLSGLIKVTSTPMIVSFTKPTLGKRKSGLKTSLLYRISNPVVSLQPTLLMPTTEYFPLRPR